MTWFNVVWAATDGLGLWSGGTPSQWLTTNLPKHALLPRNVTKKKKKKESSCEIDSYSLLSADTSMLPSLMRSFINLLVRSSSISWHCSRSLKSGLSRKESLNSSVGRPIAEPIVAMIELSLSLRQAQVGSERKQRVKVLGETWRKGSSAPPFSCLSHFFPPQNFRTPKRSSVSDRKSDNIYSASLTLLS